MLTSRSAETATMHRHQDNGHTSEHHPLLHPTSPSHRPSTSLPPRPPPPTPLFLSILTWLPLLLLLVATLTYAFTYPLLHDSHTIGGSPNPLPRLLTPSSPSSPSSSLTPSPLHPSLPSSPFSLSPHPLLKPLPDSRVLLPSVCGSWLAPYQSFHASLTSGVYFLSHFVATGAFPPHPPPLLIFRIDVHSTTGGISDRWPILSTAMLIAVLTDRAIFFDWPGYTRAYAHPHLPSMATPWQAVYHQWRWYTANTALFTPLRANNTLPHLWPSPPPYDPSTFSPPPASHVLHARTHDYKRCSMRWTRSRPCRSWRGLRSCARCSCRRGGWRM